MSFYVGAALWLGVGLIVLRWTAEAERRWQALLTERGLMPPASDSPAAALRTPEPFFRRRWAYLVAAYPTAISTADPDVETWRLRRSRRRRLFVAWMFGGLVFAISTIVVVELSERSVLWLGALLPIAALLAHAIHRGRSYGNARSQADS